MSYTIGNTFVNIHLNVNILEPKRKSFKELYIIRRTTNYCFIDVKKGQNSMRRVIC